METIIAWIIVAVLGGIIVVAVDKWITRPRFPKIPTRKVVLPNGRTLKWRDLS